jgi:hypothetical protein
MKKKADPKLTTKENRPAITDLEEFQAAYGEDWLNITRMPAFRAGLQLLNVRKLDEITSLSNEDIEKHGTLILSDLIGLLKHENAMFNLHNEKTFRLPLDEDEEYFSPEQISEMEKMKSQFREQQRKARYG